MITVFLSSTCEDLKDCRDCAAQAIEALDGCHCVRMESFGARDSMSRDLCVAKVRQCDCYVGVVGHRYGSCPDGEDKSYTEIEYEAATERNLPRLIFMASDRMRDELGATQLPEQAAKQHAFRERIRKERQLQDFDDPKTLATWVAVSLANLRQDWTSPTSSPAFGRSQPTGEAGAGLTTHARPRDRPQCSPAARSLRSFVSTDKRLNDLLDSHNLPDDHIARLFLWAHALFRRSHSDQQLGIHVANFVFALRSRLKLNRAEQDVLWITLMGPDFGLTPGWFWWREFGPRDLQALLTLSGIGDFGRLAAVRSIETLALICQDAKVFERWDLGKVASKILSLREETQTAWIHFIAKKGTLVLLPLLDRLTRDGKALVADAASRARWHIRLRTSPNESFAELLQMQSIPWELGELVKEHTSSISTAALISGLSCPEYSVAQHIEKELSKRTDIPEPEAKSLLFHKSRYIRFGAIASLINVDTTIDENVIRKTLASHDADAQRGYFGHLDFAETDPKRLIREYFEALPYEQLLPKTNWGVDGPLAYRVLATRHFDRFSARVRSDLDDEFAAVLSAWRNEMRARCREDAEKSANPSLAERITRLPYSELMREIFNQQNWDEVEECMRQLFISAALAGLVLHGTQGDVLYARKHLLEPSLLTGLLSGPRYRSEAVELLARFAQRSDTETLRQIAAEAYSLMRQVAATTLLELAPGVNDISRQLLNSTDREISNLAMESLAKCRTKTARGLLEDRLKDENASTRLRALKIVTRPMRRRDLEKLLERYIAKGAYYYDVVCWIDRILYAPQPLRAVYRQQLESEQT